MKYSQDELLQVFLHLESNPYATYDDLALLFPDRGVNVNSVVKRLQRMGCISIERDFDIITGKIRGTKKTAVRRP